MTTSELAELVQTRKIVTCLGSGGVGKTTAAAALAVWAARSGRRTAVLTIDPARRLQDSLGLSGLEAEPVHVSLGPPGTGSLHAMRLDVKRTFDALVERFAPNEATAARVLANRLYKTISNGLAGSVDYMAMEKLYELATDSTYDLIVLDTPPTRHALDFLKAPERMIDLLRSRAVTILRNPSTVLSTTGSRIANQLLTGILRGLERFTGFEVLHDLSDFVSGFEHMTGGFQERADAVAGMLRSASSAFVLVTTPDRAKIGETLAFTGELIKAGLPLSGFIVNRMLPPSLVANGVSADPGPDKFLAKLEAVHSRIARLVCAERAAVGELLAMVPPGCFVVEAPALVCPPTSIAGLDLLGRLLCAGQEG